MEIRCSKLARPMSCAGYLFLQYDEPPSGPAAEEGTAAGEYLQSLLEGTQLGANASNGVFITDEMKFYTTPIAQDMFNRAVGPITCEQRLDWQTQSGVWIRGKPDATFVDNRNYLCIEDLKYGWGIVEVFENWQLLGYAIGEVMKRGVAFEYISLKIHQPRPHHEDGTSREWLISFNELLTYKQRIEDRFMQIVNGYRDLQTGSHCKYCPAAAEACPAFSRLFYSSLEVSMRLIQDSLTEEEIAIQLDQIIRASEVIKIKHDSLVELGTSRIKQGKLIPGYIQTERYGNRTWKKNVNPVALEALTGIKLREEVVMTPAKAEKAGLSKELVKQLTETNLIGMKLEKKNGADLGNKIFGNQSPTLGGNLQ